MGCYYLDSLGGVGEAYDVYAVVCHSGLQDLRTVPVSEQVPTGHTGDFWHKRHLLTDSIVMGFVYIFHIPVLAWAITFVNAHIVCQMNEKLFQVTFL